MRALLYAFIKGYPVFFTEPNSPARFEYFSPYTDLSFLKIPRVSKKLKTFNGIETVGLPKEDLWQLVLFFLNMDGNAPLANLCKSMRYDGVNLVCYNDYSKIAEIGFENCYYFYDPNTSGLVNELNIENKTYICYDYIGFHKGGKHEIDYISTDDDFVSKIWFYSSDRICGDTGVKDACVLSKLTTKQIEDFSFSETMARFKAISIMYDNGMKGQLNGYTKKGTPRYRKFKTSFLKREKHLLCEPSWTAPANIKKVLQTEEEMMETLQQINYDRYYL